MILTNIFGFSNNIAAAFPGKPVLFTENYKALSRNTSRYENLEKFEFDFVCAVF